MLKLQLQKSLYDLSLLSPLALVPNSVTAIEFAAKFFSKDFVRKNLKKKLFFSSKLFLTGGTKMLLFAAFGLEMPCKNYFNGNTRLGSN
jgi:hypothetical protein